MPSLTIHSHSAAAPALSPARNALRAILATLFAAKSPPAATQESIAEEATPSHRRANQFDSLLPNLGAELQMLAWRS